MARTTVLTVEARPRGYYRGWDLYLGGVKIGVKPYDGSEASEAEDEVVQALAGLLRERLGWQENVEEEEGY